MPARPLGLPPKKENVKINSEPPVLQVLTESGAPV